MTEWPHFEAWKKHCIERGLDGPHRIHGRGELTGNWQFVGESGTAALWNTKRSCGYVFDEVPDPTRVGLP